LNFTLTVVVLLCIIALFVVAALSPSGLKMELFFLGKFLPGELHYQQVSGVIVGPIKIKDLSYQDKNIKVTIKQLHLQWELLALIQKKLHIENIKSQGINIVTLNKERNFKPFKPTIPLIIQIDHGQFANIQLHLSQKIWNKNSLQLQQLQFNGLISNKILNLY